MKTTTKHVIVATLILAAFSGAWAKGYNSDVRVIHASPDAPAVDVWVNGSPAITDLAFGEVSPYASLRAGEYDVQVVPTGATSPVVIDVQNLSLFYNTDYTVLAVNTLDKIEPLLLVDDNRPNPIPFARVRFVHASPDAPAVDVAVEGGPVLFSNVAFKGVGDYVSVPAGVYNLEVRVAGTQNVALSLRAIPLEGGTTYTAVAVGFAGGSPSLRAVLATDSESPAKFRGRRR